MSGENFASDMRAITGISVVARLTLAAHALNNEGSRNNALMPRQIDVVHDGDVVQANAISGDSVKHTFVDHLRALLLQARGAGAADGLPLCAPCAHGDPNRLNADPNFQTIAQDKNIPDAEVLDHLLHQCVIDDVAGLLVTQGNRNAPRRTTAQFGWLVGRPNHVRTGRYIHLKLVPGSPEANKEKGGNLGQNLFTRPASSGQYAFLATADLARIGVNDVTWEPTLDFTSRQRRARLVVEALFRTVSNPQGAQLNTQLPHLGGVEGAVCISRSTLPPVLYSPLTDGYIEQMEQVARAFNRSEDDLEVIRFGTLGELGQLLTSIASARLAA